MNNTAQQATTIASNTFNDLGFSNLEPQLRQSLQDQQKMQQERYANNSALPDQAIVQQDDGPSQTDEQQAANAPQQPAFPPQQEQAQLGGNEEAQGGQQASQPMAQRYQTNRDEREQMLRGGVEFDRRNRAFQQYAGQAALEQRQGETPAPPRVTVTEGRQPAVVGGRQAAARPPRNRRRRAVRARLLAQLAADPNGPGRRGGRPAARGRVAARDQRGRGRSFPACWRRCRFALP